MMNGLMSRCLMEIVKEAISSYSSNPSSLMFNTAGIQSAFDRRFPELHGVGSSEVKELLLAEPRIVRLSGGSHWILLPNGMKRYIENGV